jgi:hypothetical protein
MNTLGDAFTLELHTTHLKPLGFKNTGRTFVRSHDGYTERFQLQGSAWNSPDHPWRFYLNCGITFEGLPRRKPDGNFPHTHAWMSGPLITAAAMPEYNITEKNLPSTIDQVAEVIRQCSDYFQRRHAILRDCYEHRRYHMGVLADPELRNAKVQPRSA